jgi:Arc/MetJ-type ribon-helix-helix transcriptional regulator
MMIYLSTHIESSIQAVIKSGLFASVDVAMTEAASLLLQRLKQSKLVATLANHKITTDPILGSMPDAADELDEIVADAMKWRREEPWRAIAGE